MVASTMKKYGSLPEDIRFELDDWALVTPGKGVEGLDCVHGCNRKDKYDVFIQWSYSIPSDPFCPGCGETMPDEIQGLYQMANMDCRRPSIPYGWMVQEVARQVAKKHREFEKKLFLSGVGYVQNGCKK